MSSQPQTEKIGLPRLVLGLGFFLIFLAVGIGAATTNAGDIPKYLAGVAGVAIAVGAIWSALEGDCAEGSEVRGTVQSGPHVATASRTHTLSALGRMDRAPNARRRSAVKWRSSPLFLGVETSGS